MRGGEFSPVNERVVTLQLRVGNRSSTVVSACRPNGSAKYLARSDILGRPNVLCGSTGNIWMNFLPEGSLTPTSRELQPDSRGWLVRVDRVLYLHYQHSCLDTAIGFLVPVVVATPKPCSGNQK